MKRDSDILRKVVDYCHDIEMTTSRFGNDYNTFKQDYDYVNSVCMSLLQIGELANHLSDVTRQSMKSVVPWKSIRGMRNMFAHNYGAIDTEIIWHTVCADIPDLRANCQKWLNEKAKYFFGLLRRFS